MEGPIDKDALFEAIDQNGPYTRGLTGTLEPESVVKFHRVTQDHAYRAFKATKEENLKKRLKLLKAKKDKEYKESILQTQLEFQKVAARTTQLAAEFIELD